MWKFWKWDLGKRGRVARSAQVQLMQLHAELESARQQVTRQRELLRAELESAAELKGRLEGALSSLQAAGVLGSVRQRPLPKPDLLAALAGLAPESDLWRGLHAVLDDQRQIETSMVCEPGLGNELAHVRRGRLAAVLDLQATLIDLYAEAHRPLGAAGK